MAITDTTDSIPVTTTVAVRVPHDSDADLETGAERRLSRLDGVREATVAELRGLRPGLSATVVTVTATIDSSISVAELRDRFQSSTSIDAIERLDDT